MKSGRPARDRTKVLRQITEESFAEAQNLESKWLGRMEELSIQRKPGLFYRRYWANTNKHARMR
jgi:hypothetical protein